MWDAKAGESEFAAFFAEPIQGTGGYIIPPPGYFEKLKDNNPQIGRSIQDTLTMLRSGERMVAAGSTSTAFESKVKGEPIDVAYQEEGTLVVVAPSCVLKGAKKPNAAKLFMEYMSSPAASQIAVDFDIVVAVATTAGPISTSSAS